MSSDLQPSPMQLLEERLSDKVLTKPTTTQLQAIYDLAIYSTRIVLQAGFAGNVQCRAAVPEILRLFQLLKS